ncbi:hypothetical protein RF11_15461 [Thelohanellus kitauei]|uniref:Uncharacterized protein n=1 Tax=Thelohanellus kitauei TaxID=669202 RepID=A0A0C2IYU6_THEKT|nr:hypothetical protein RF11_15461 [Thelohanellus kitauei]
MASSKLYATWQIDFMGPLPTTCKENSYIHVMADYFSRGGEATPTHDEKADIAVEAVTSMVYRDWNPCSYSLTKRSDLSQSSGGPLYVHETLRPDYIIYIRINQDVKLKLH